MTLLPTFLMLVFGAAALLAYSACAVASRADEAAGHKDTP